MYADVVSIIVQKSRIFLHFHSGYKSYGKPKDKEGLKKGAWFINVLCKVFSQWWEKMELMEMMTLVNKEVAHKYMTPTTYVKQMPCFTSMLTKQVFFTPKKTP